MPRCSARASTADCWRAALAGEVELDDLLWQRLHGIVDPDATGRMRFRNTLVRDAAYEGLPFRRRSELHGRVAQAIESTAASPEEEAPTLALHFFEAQRHDKAWHYGRVAGDRARAVAATVEAARFYELALDAGRYVRGVTSRERADVLVALGKVRQSAGLFDQSFDAFRRATILLPDDPVERARRVRGPHTGARAHRPVDSLHSGRQPLGYGLWKVARSRPPSRRARGCSRCEARSACCRAVPVRRFHWR